MQNILSTLRKKHVMKEKPVGQVNIAHGICDVTVNNSTRTSLSKPTHIFTRKPIANKICKLNYRII